MPWIMPVPNLMRIAQHAAERSKTTKSDALVALAFAAASIEGFLNEVMLHIELHDKDHPNSVIPDVTSLARILKEFERRNASLRAKLEVSALVLRSDSWSAGEQPLQDVLLLTDLRNAILHPRPMVLSDGNPDSSDSPDKFVAALLSRRVISVAPTLPPIPKPGASRSEVSAPWFNAIQCEEVAKWAVSTARIAIATFAETFPSGSRFRAELEHLIRHAYGFDWK